MDIANARSLHEGVVPRTGGIAIVVTFVLSIIGYYLLRDEYFIGERAFWGFFAAALMIALVGIYDDVTSKGMLAKILSQLIGVAVLISVGLVVNSLTIPFIGKVQLGILAYPITVIWIMGITNAVNFMDGIDGLIAGTVLIGSLAFMMITYMMGSAFVYHASYFLAASCLGFLIYNFPKASIFMGDVGSTFLGFTIGALAILAANYDGAHTPFMIIPILFANIIIETFMTFMWRLMKGRKVYRAHKQHPYQLLVQMGVNAKAVTLIYYAQTVLLALVSILYVKIDAIGKLYLLLTVAISCSLYFAIIYRRASRLNLLKEVAPIRRRAVDGRIRLECEKCT